MDQVPFDIQCIIARQNIDVYRSMFLFPSFARGYFRRNNTLRDTMMTRYIRVERRKGTERNNYTNGSQYLLTFRAREYMKILTCDAYNIFILSKTNEELKVYSGVNYRRLFEYSIRTLKIPLNMFRIPGLAERCEYILELGYKLAKLKKIPVNASYDAIKIELLMNYGQPYYEEYIESLTKTKN